MKIVDLKCAVIGRHPLVRILTDEGIVGTGQVESSKPYLKPHVLFYRDLVLGMDPTDVGARHARHPAPRRLQALGQCRQRHRDGALGHRRQGRRGSGVQAARRQDPRPGAGLPDRLSGSGNGLPARGVRRRRPRRQGAAAGVHPVQDGRLLPQRHARGRPRLLLRGELGAAAGTPTGAR